MVFQGVSQFKNKYKFVNIETSYEEVTKDLEADKKQEPVNENEKKEESVPDDDLAAFSLWLKKELEPVVNKVQVSTRLTDSPALIQGQMSSGMRQIMKMLEKDGNQAQSMPLNNNLTLEINAKHPLMVALNKTRRKDIGMAALLAKQLLDNTMLMAGLLENERSYVSRVNQLMMGLMQADSPVQMSSVAPLDVQEMERDPQVQSMLNQLEEEQSSDDEQNDQFDTEILIDEQGNPKLNKNN